MTKGQRYWIPDLKPLVMHECFPESVYDKCFAGVNWGRASLERVEAHVASNGTPLSEMFVLKIFLDGYPFEPFALAIRLDNPLLKNHVSLVMASDAIFPPLSAEFLFHLFLATEKCGALLGDLEEGYKLIHKKFGPSAANFWYWTQALRSVGPIAWAWAKTAVLKPVIGVIAWALAKSLIGHDSWLASVVEIWKRIRS